ncbi:hypothetical protein ACIBHX_32895 [Nonomuraea sp. NPDC050536]|uniref:hypothetical protein n=1 Tax=Nonomuraea sp. NPDC050536 TaxID=3364366 RepID=UPI0037CB89CE
MSCRSVALLLYGKPPHRHPLHFGQALSRETLLRCSVALLLYGKPPHRQPPYFGWALSRETLLR